MVIGVGTAGVELALAVLCLVQLLGTDCDTDVGIWCAGSWPIVVNRGPRGTVAEDANHSHIAIFQQSPAHRDDVVRMNDAERHGALPDRTKERSQNAIELKNKMKNNKQTCSHLFN